MLRDTLRNDVCQKKPDEKNDLISLSLLAPSLRKTLLGKWLSPSYYSPGCYLTRKLATPRARPAKSRGTDAPDIANAASSRTWIVE